MTRIMIAREPNTNEAVASYLAEHVANDLKSQGFDCDLIDFPSMHEMMEGFASADDGTMRRLSDYLEKPGLVNLLDEEAKQRLADSLLFFFHNYRTTDFNPRGVFAYQLPIACWSGPASPLMEEFFTEGDPRYMSYSGEDISWDYERHVEERTRIRFGELGGFKVDEGVDVIDEFVIEIPAIHLLYSSRQKKPYIEAIERCRELRPDLNEQLDELVKTYFTDYADIPYSESQGYLDSRLVNRLTSLVKRIAFLSEVPNEELYLSGKIE